jgi:hypothetical protein
MRSPLIGHNYVSMTRVKVGPVVPVAHASQSRPKGAPAMDPKQASATALISAFVGSHHALHDVPMIFDDFFDPQRAAECPDQAAQAYSSACLRPPRGSTISVGGTRAVALIPD